MSSFQLFLQQLSNGLTLGSIYALIALGYTMVYGVIQLINFAHGEVFMAGAYVALFIILFLSAMALPWWLVFVVSVAVSAFVCSLIGWLVERLA